MDIDQEIKILLDKTKIKLSKEEYAKFKIDFLEYKKSLKNIDQLDLSNQKTYRTPFDVTSSYLREDEINIEVDYKEILKNSKNKENNYIVLEKE